MSKNNNMKYIRVKNFEKYQHYSGRNIIWVKSYIDTPQDESFAELKDSLKYLFVALCWEAARTNNVISWNIKHLRRNLALTSKTVGIQALIDAGFVEEIENPASKMLATCYQDASTIREEKRRIKLHSDGSADGAPKSDGSKKKPKPKPKPRVDMLEGKPMLEKIHTRLRECIIEEHPKARLPKPDSAGWFKEREELERMHRVDGYTEAELAGCFKWLWTSDDQQAVFWRKNVQGIAALRKARDGMTKLGRIMTDWAESEKSESGGSSLTVERAKVMMRDFTPEQIRRLGFDPDLVAEVAKREG